MSLTHPRSFFDTPCLHDVQFDSHTQCLPGVSQSKCWEVCLLGSCSLHCSHHSMEPVLPKRHTTQHLKLRYWRWQLREYPIYGGTRHTSSMYTAWRISLSHGAWLPTVQQQKHKWSDVPPQMAFHWMCQDLVWIIHQWNKSVLYSYRLVLVQRALSMRLSDSNNMTLWRL